MKFVAFSFNAPVVRRMATGIICCPCPFVHTYVCPSIPKFLPTQLLLYHWTDIHETYSQYLSWYIVIHKGWNLHMRIPTVNNVPLLLCDYIGKIIVKATPSVPLDRHSRNLLTVLVFVCSRPLRLGFAFAHSYYK